MQLHISKEPDHPFRQRITVDGFTFYADIPEKIGGENSAPDPHDYFDAAIAACKALTMLLYAKRKELTVDTMEMTFTRDDSEERQGKYALNGEITLPEHLSDTEKQMLIDIAGRCPIHKLVTSTEVAITLKEKK
jgi:putative redox protein